MLLLLTVPAFAGCNESNEAVKPEKFAPRPPAESGDGKSSTGNMVKE
jgi:hypothetical protein